MRTIQVKFMVYVQYKNLKKVDFYDYLGTKEAT